MVKVVVWEASSYMLNELMFPSGLPELVPQSYLEYYSLEIIKM